MELKYSPVQGLALCFIYLVFISLVSGFIFTVSILSFILSVLIGLYWTWDN
jgi:xanthine/uracil/vitamin C permease (AzgA family)